MRRPPPGHVFVTGASSGLGAGMARSYAAPGTRLSLTGRDPARLEAVAAACRALGAEVACRVLDVTDAPALAGFVLECDDIRPIGLLIACAGTSASVGADGAPEGAAQAGRQIATNLVGTMNAVEPLLPRLLARREGQLAVVSSVAGYRGLPFSPGYSASKAGVRAYGDALGAWLAPRGIAVSVVVPGFFDTPMTDRFQGDKPMLRSLPQMVAAVRRGLDQRRRRIVHPRLLGLGIQFTDLAPAWLGDAILRRVPFHIHPGG